MARETVGSVAMEVTADLQKFQQQTEKGAADAGAKAGTSFSKLFRDKFSRANEDLQKHGGLFGALLTGAGLGAGLGGFGLAVKGVEAVTDAITGAIGAASDLAESQSKVNVVFKDGAQEITRWASTSAKSMGISTQAALENAATFGNLFDALGLATEQQVKMSKGAVQLASDLASFNNADPSEVLLAIRSGLLGEAEPMRKFGASLSEARVKAYGMAHALADVKGNMTDAQKVQARYNLILQDTSLAQGDFARTANGMANSQRTLDAELADLSAAVGGIIAPLGKGFVDAALGAINVIGSLGNAFNDLRRFMDPSSATIEDATRVLDDLAKGRGVDVNIVKRYTAAQKDAQDRQDAYNEVIRQSINAFRAQQGWAEDYVATQEELNVQQGFVNKQLTEAGYILDENVQTWKASAAATKLANDQLNQYVKVADLATKTGLDLSTMQDEIVARMKASSITWAAAVQQIAIEVFQKRFIPVGLAAADAFTRSYHARLAANFAESGTSGGFVPIITNATAQFTRDFHAHLAANFAKDARDLWGDMAKGIVPKVMSLQDAFKDFEATASVTMDRVQNKRGKGWHWAKDVSTRLHDLRVQFRDDLATINWLLAHPGGARKTRNELVRQLGVLERKRDKALDSKDWEAFGKIEQEINDTHTAINNLDGSEATVTVRLNLARGARQQIRNLADSGGAPGQTSEGVDGSHAQGLAYVPYDNYLAYLHKGERVVPAAQNVGGGTMRHIHQLAPGTAAVLRSAGFDDRAVAGFLLASPSQGMRRWEDE